MAYITETCLSSPFLSLSLSLFLCVPDHEQVDRADPAFPRPAGFWWFGCSSIDQGKRTSWTAATTTRTPTPSTSRPSYKGWGHLWPWQSDQARADVPISYDDDDDDDIFAGQDALDSGSNNTNSQDEEEEDSRRSGSGGTNRWKWWFRVKDVVKDVIGSRIG